MTNAGVLQTTQKATISSWGRAWYNEQAKTNIFSYAEMAKKHQITYDSEIEDAFKVYLPNKIVKFTKTDQGLYIYKPRIKKNKKTSNQFMNKIQEIKNIEIKRALEEPPGFKFEKFNHQDKYIQFAGVSEIIPIVVEEIKNQEIKMELQEKNEMKIENQDIKIDQQEIENNIKIEENQETKKIENKILPKLKAKYIKNKIKIKNKKIQDNSCLTNEARIKNKFKFVNYFKKKGKIFMVNQQECVGK